MTVNSNSATFTANVSAITSAFGDPTRRSIYLFVREHTSGVRTSGVRTSGDHPSGDHPSGEFPSGEFPAGVTAAQVAERFGLHPNVARHHLDKLAAGGYLEVAVERTEGAGAGRPSKRYRALVDIDMDAPLRGEDLVLTLLGRALALLPRDQAEAMAEQVGQEYGRAMAVPLIGNRAPGEAQSAGQRSLRSAMQAVADALTAHGFAAHADQRSDQLRIVNNHCPFGAVAIEHPVICAVDRGMVKGMLGALCGDTEVSAGASLPRGDTFCSTNL